mmetsp:Transcript_39172/g.72320  ORF Transcript_39172/g.72320 Transcript_39172/m.72320 type:complete len:202 (-) Transcript_39172:302-907(-)
MTRRGFWSARCPGGPRHIESPRALAQPDRRPRGSSTRRTRGVLQHWGFSHQVSQFWATSSPTFGDGGLDCSVPSPRSVPECSRLTPSGPPPWSYRDQGLRIEGTADSSACTLPLSLLPVAPLSSRITFCRGLSNSLYRKDVQKDCALPATVPILQPRESLCLRLQGAWGRPSPPERGVPPPLDGWRSAPTLQSSDGPRVYL